MFRFDIIINLAMLLSFAAILAITVHRREGVVRAAYCLIFCIGLGAAFIFKLGITMPENSVFTPFNKLFNVSQYGCIGIIEDISAYALPYMLAGFLFMPAFPRFKAGGAFAAGVAISLCSRIYYLLEGGSFVSDEYIFAGIGMAAGCALYILAAYALRKKIDFNEFKLPLPRRSGFIWSFAVLLISYIGIALMMIFGYSEPYNDIFFAQSGYELPADITLACTLDDAAAKLFLYIPTEQPLEERLAAVAQSVGIYNEAVDVYGTYVAEDETGKVTMTEGGSWVYESYAQPEGNLPTADSAVNATFRFFSNRHILSTDIDKVTDIIERTDEANGERIGYDVYLSSSVNGQPIKGSCAIVVSVRAGDTIIKIRRYDGDIQTGAQLNGISQQKAFEYTLDGKCANTLGGQAISASVTACKLIYMQNPDGYYLPVWEFSGVALYAEGMTGEFNIYVQADA